MPACQGFFCKKQKIPARARRGALHGGAQRKTSATQGGVLCTAHHFVRRFTPHNGSSYTANLPAQRVVLHSGSSCARSRPVRRGALRTAFYKKDMPPENNADPRDRPAKGKKRPHAAAFWFIRPRKGALAQRPTRLWLRRLAALRVRLWKNRRRNRGSFSLF